MTIDHDAAGTQEDGRKGVAPGLPAVLAAVLAHPVLIAVPAGLLAMVHYFVSPRIAVATCVVAVAGIVVAAVRAKRSRGRG